MKFIINDKHKKDIFIAMFQIIKSACSTCNMIFEDEMIHIQGMDKTHICLFDINIKQNWFDLYEIDYSKNDLKNISFDAEVFHSIINCKNDETSMIIFFDGNADNLNVDIIYTNKNCKGYFDKHFKIPLLMTGDSVNFDVEINKKQARENFTQSVKQEKLELKDALQKEFKVFREASEPDSIENIPDGSMNFEFEEGSEGNDNDRSGKEQNQMKDKPGLKFEWED